MDANILETMQKKTAEKKIVYVCVDGPSDACLLGNAAALSLCSFGFLLCTTQHPHTHHITMHAHLTPLIILTLTPHVIVLSDLSLLSI